MHPWISSPVAARARLVAPLALLAGFVLAAAGCAQSARPPAPPAPTPDPRLSLAVSAATPRAGASGAPVDCAVDVANRSGKTIARLVLTCELLDAEGVPVGAGLGAVQNLPDGERRAVRTVVYGVRSFASARALVASADFR